MKSKKLPLAFWIFVGLLVGVVAGLLLIPMNIGGMAGKDFAAAYIKPWGDIFLNLLKFIVVPIVLFSIASGARWAPWAERPWFITCAPPPSR